MKIAAVETLRLRDYPNLIWVVIEDADGLRGTGETFFGPEAVEAHIHASAAPLLLGRDARDRDAIRRALIPYAGHQAPGVELRAASAIDLALWDLWGRHLDQPVWRLLGGRSREAVRVYNTCAGYGYVRQATGQRSENWGLGGAAGPYEDLEAFLTDAGALAESLLDQGVSAMKIWPFDRYAEASGGMAITPAELDEGLEPFRRIRAAVGDAMQVMLEMHSLWSLPTAVDIARAAAAHGIFWIEDPIRMNGFSSLADFRRRVPVKVTASETLATRQQFRALMEARAVDVVMFDLGWCGGLTEARAIADMAEAWHLPVAPHDCTGPLVWAASCHLSLNAPNALIQECVRAFHTGWYREVADCLPPVENGTVRPGDGPGWGTALKPALFERPDAVRRRTGA